MLRCCSRCRDGGLEPILSGRRAKDEETMVEAQKDSSPRSSYVPLTNVLVSKEAIVNMKNHDEQCFEINSVLQEL